MSPLHEAGLDRDESMTYFTDLGHLIVILLGGTLSGLHDRLAQDGFETAADLVGDLVEVVDGYLMRV